jgi:hypothetical protein
MLTKDEVIQGADKLGKNDLTRGKLTALVHTTSLITKLTLYY